MLRRALCLVLLGLALALGGGSGAPAPGGAAALDRVPHLGGNWFLLGYNYPWHSYNYDFGNERYSNVHAEYAKIDAQFKELAAAGTHVTRWYIFNDASVYPLFDAQGVVSGLPTSFFQNFDDALAIASANNVYLIPV